LPKLSKLGKCLNCGDESILQSSHAINKTFFQEISQKCKETHGRSLQLEFGNMFPKLDGDQLATLQMCSACENFFNSKYENYSIKFLKGKLSITNKRETKKYICYSNIDHTKISKFLLSIFWKISNSNHKYLKNVAIFPKEANIVIRDCLNSETPLCKLDCNLKIFKLKDSSYNLSDDSLKQIIMTPFLSYSESTGQLTYRMIFYGYLFQLFFKRISYDEKKKGRYLKDGNGSLYIDFIELDEIKEFTKLIFDSCY
jgi:hypothetical protein